MTDPPELDPPSGLENAELWWYLSDPPALELHLANGVIVRHLTVAHFFDVTKFSVAYVSAARAAPPLPDTKQGPFLRAAFYRLLEHRHEIAQVAEASDEGSMLADIRLAILACPRSDAPEDIDHGAIYLVPDDAPTGAGEAWINARTLQARVVRACLVRFGPADYYRALQQLGLASLGPRRSLGWQGRVWSVPPSLLPAARTNALAPVVAPQPPPPAQLPLGSSGAEGAFDDPL